MNYIDIALLFGFGFVCGGYWNAHSYRKQLEKIAINAEIYKKIIKYIPVLETEIHENIIFAYEKNTDNFMCQGKTLEEVAKNLMDFRKIDIALVNHGGQSFWFVRGQIRVIEQ